MLRPLQMIGLNDPEVARLTLSTIRAKLDALEFLLQDMEPACAGSDEKIDVASMGGGDADGGDALDALGRNQKARMREMWLLDILASEARPFSIQQLMAGLQDRGLGDKQPAVVSQLHRMKASSVIDQPGIGMYAITQAGLAHLRKLKASIGALFKS